MPKMWEQRVFDVIEATCVTDIGVMVFTVILFVFILFVYYDYKNRNGDDDEQTEK